MHAVLLLSAFFVALRIADTSSGVSELTFGTNMSTTLLTTTSPTPNSTTISVPSETPSRSPDLVPGYSNSNTASNPDDRRDSVVNYYFLFLAIFGVMIAIFVWWAQKRRKQRKQQMRMSGQNALAQDLEGWVNTRRWFHGTRRPNQTAAFVRREEGLNEQGEAPPPYEPNGDATVPQDQIAANGLTVPLRVVSRQDHAEGRLPEYRETLDVHGASVTQANNANIPPEDDTHRVR